METRPRCAKEPDPNSLTPKSLITKDTLPGRRTLAGKALARMKSSMV
jgi:hypothetical protein